MFILDLSCQLNFQVEEIPTGHHECFLQVSQKLSFMSTDDWVFEVSNFIQKLTRE